ncbi:MAG: hypothetical protein FWG88_00685 [Oscillospiraceae bacterium]|nr:hypothetical protein [Oscillospiraceae bacterium]
MKKLFSERRLIRYIFFTFVFTIIFALVRLIQAPTEAVATDSEIRIKRDYIWLLAWCIIGVVALMIPLRLKHRRGLDIPSIMMGAYALFLYCAIYLGEVRTFYIRIPHWDTILHTFSGAALAAIGFSIISLLNNSDSIPLSLSPVFVALFSFCFALSLGAIWEIYEFSMDFYLDTNMQRYALMTGEVLIGKAALLDTMKDLIVDAAGAFVISTVGYISLKYEKGWLEKLSITRSNI